MPQGSRWEGKQKREEAEIVSLVLPYRCVFPFIAALAQQIPGLLQFSSILLPSSFMVLAMCYGSLLMLFSFGKFYVDFDRVFGECIQ